MSQYAAIAAANHRTAAKNIPLNWAHQLMLQDIKNGEDTLEWTRATLNARAPQGAAPVTEPVSALERHLRNHGLVEELRDSRTGHYYYCLTGIGHAALAL